MKISGKILKLCFKKARMAQAERLIKMDFEGITKNEVSTLIAGSCWHNGFAVIKKY